jgi:MFS family permease
VFVRSLSRRLRDRSTTQLVALISFFGQLYFFVPVMTPYLLGYDLSMAQIAGMQTTLLFAMLAMEVPTGVIADRIGHRRSYQVALALGMLGELITLAASTYPQFLAAQLVAGTGFAFASGSVDALVYESLPGKDRETGMTRARGTIGAALHLASVVAYGGSAMINADLSRGSMRLSLLLGALSLGVATLLSLTLRDAPSAATASARPDSLALLRDGWRVVRSNPRLRRLLLLALATNAFGAHLLVFYQDYFLQVGVPGLWFGLALGLGSLVAMLAEFHAWRLPLRLGQRGALVLAAALPGALYLAIAASHQPALAIGLFIVQWGAIHLAGPIYSGAYNAEISGAARATALSLISAVTTVYVGLMGLLFGWLANRSLPLVFALMGALILAALGILAASDLLPARRSGRATEQLVS